MKPLPKKYIFSGHDSFQCRQLWLKKGYDFVKSGKSFGSEDAVVTLGVGKNMVSAIRYWMKAFQLLTTDDKLTPFADKLLAENGYDPYLEDEASLWLLHYSLVSSGYSSSYSIIFNELRREKIEFTKENFVAFVKRKPEVEKMQTIGENTLADDFSVLTKMYVNFEDPNKDKEDNLSGLLTELDLIKSFSKEKTDYYVIENNERPSIPEEVLLYAILNTPDLDLSVGYSSLEQDFNSIGSIFALSRSGLINKIEQIVSKYSYITFNDQAGIKELQFKRKPAPFTILDKYYAN